MKLVILGSSAAVPDASHLNTHFALCDQDRTILVDCSGNQIIRLEEAGIPIESISDIILTHFHPDHVGGIPLFLMNMWLLDRTGPLAIHGLQDCLDRFEQMMALFRWEMWPDVFQISLQSIPENERAEVLTYGEMQIISSPVNHVIPTVGLRFEFPGERGDVAYSSDTEPCDSMIRLAKGARVLIHESTGERVGHSSARQAGEIARQAQVSELVLIHYPGREGNEGELLQSAGEKFDGAIRLAEDFMEIEL